MKRDSVVEAVGHSPSPGAMLGMAFDGWMEALPSVLLLPERLDDLERKLNTLERLLIEQISDTEGLSPKIDGIEGGLKALCDRNDLLEHASQHQAQLTDQHYRDHVVGPVARQIIPLVDMTEEVLSASESGEDSDSASPLIRGIRDDLQEALDRLGVEQFRSPPGSSFDPKCMQPVRFEQTAILSQDRTVAENVRAGYLMDLKVLRPASVAIYQFKMSDQMTSNNGGKSK